MALIATPALLKARLSDTSGQFGDEKMIDLIDFILGGVRRHCRTLVSLTAVATPTLFTVPEGYDYYHDNIMVEGVVAQSGGTSSVLKVGKSGALNFLNETTGHTFVAATATTLIAAADRRSMNDLYGISNMNGSTIEKVAGGTAVVADVSGTVLTAGSVYVECYGFLVPQG